MKYIFLVKDVDISTYIPTKIIENLTFTFNKISYQINVPISTYETPLFASIKRGVKVSKVHPISVAVLSDCMTRSVIFQCKNVEEVERFVAFLEGQLANGKTQEIVATTSHHCKILEVENQVVGNLVYASLLENTEVVRGKLQKLADLNKDCNLVLQLRRKNRVCFQTK